MGVNKESIEELNKQQLQIKAKEISNELGITRDELSERFGYGSWRSFSRSAAFVKRMNGIVWIYDELKKTN
ncbi:MAG: hypothetical protein CL843_09295 [Crocinitomicaceae bacterium]|nr:hypothetical protein [Crocinitomicaceae bacterium]|tara:strand:+ start:61 stop:273 length:213 start_codon:yes stop_codon:yes gene_type:complete